MSRITGSSFNFGGDGYKFEIDFVDQSVTEGAIFDLSVHKEQGYYPSDSATAQVRYQGDSGRIIIQIDDKQADDRDIFSLSVGDLPDYVDALPIQYMDPVIGCAIKSGLYAVIRQILECLERLPDGDLWQQFPDLLRCLMANFGSISKMALYRLFRCIAQSFGLPVD